MVLIFVKRDLGQISSFYFLARRESATLAALARAELGKNCCSLFVSRLVPGTTNLLFVRPFES